MARMNKVTADTDIKAEIDKRIIKGHAAIFDNLDSDRDVIQKGAFAQSIRDDFNPPGKGKSRIKLLWQHKRHEVIGRPHILIEDAKGLYFESRVSKTVRGDEALELIRDHAVDEMSFGFDVMKANWIDWNIKGQDATIRARLLTQLKIWEISPVTWGANSSTTVEEGKAYALDLLIKEFRETEDVTPDQIKSLESMLNSRILELEDLRTLLGSGMNGGDAFKGKDDLNSITSSLDNFNNFLQGM